MPWWGWLAVGGVLGAIVLYGAIIATFAKMRW